MAKKGKNKQDKPIVPYKINLKISLKDLDGVPDDTDASEITRNWCIKAMLSHGEASRGFSIQNHRQLKLVRDKFEEAIKTKQKFVELEPEDFKFFKRCWDAAQLPPSANEVVCRIDELICDAVSNHDRELNEGMNKEDKPVSSQNS